MDWNRGQPPGSHYTGTPGASGAQGGNTSIFGLISKVNKGILKKPSNRSPSAVSSSQLPAPAGGSGGPVSHVANFPQTKPAGSDKEAVFLQAKSKIEQIQKGLWKSGSKSTRPEPGADPFKVPIMPARTPAAIRPGQKGNIFTKTALVEYEDDEDEQSDRSSSFSKVKALQEIDKYIAAPKSKLFSRERENVSRGSEGRPDYYPPSYRSGETESYPQYGRESRDMTREDDTYFDAYSVDDRAIRHTDKEYQSYSPNFERNEDSNKPGQYSSSYEVFDYGHSSSEYGSKVENKKQDEKQSKPRRFEETKPLESYKDKTTDDFYRNRNFEPDRRYEDAKSTNRDYQDKGASGFGVEQNKRVFTENKKEQNNQGQWKGSSVQRSIGDFGNDNRFNLNVESPSRNTFGNYPNNTGFDGSTSATSTPEPYGYPHKSDLGNKGNEQFNFYGRNTEPFVQGNKEKDNRKQGEDFNEQFNWGYKDNRNRQNEPGLSKQQPHLDNSLRGIRRDSESSRGSGDMLYEDYLFKSNKKDDTPDKNRQHSLERDAKQSGFENQRQNNTQSFRNLDTEREIGSPRFRDSEKLMQTGSQGFRDSEKNRQTGSQGFREAEKDRQTGSRGLRDSEKQKQTGLQGFKDSEKNRQTGSQGVRDSEKNRQTGSRGLRDSEKQKQTGSQRFRDSEKQKQNSSQGFRNSEKQKQNNSQGLRDSEKNRQTGLQGIRDSEKNKQTGSQGFREAGKPRQSRFHRDDRDMQGYNDQDDSNMYGNLSRDRYSDKPRDYEDMEQDHYGAAYDDYGADQSYSYRDDQDNTYWGGEGDLQYSVPVQTFITDPGLAMAVPQMAVPAFFCKDCSMTFFDQEVYETHLKSDSHLLVLQKRAQELFHLNDGRRKSRFDVVEPFPVTQMQVPLTPVTMVTGPGAVIPPRPKGPLQAENVGCTSLTISWGRLTSQEASLVEEYVVEYRNARETRWVTIGHTTKYDFIVDELQENTDYLFRVFAISGQEKSEVLESVLITTRRRKDPPNRRPGRTSPERGRAGRDRNKTDERDKKPGSNSNKDRKSGPDSNRDKKSSRPDANKDRKSSSTDANKDRKSGSDTNRDRKSGNEEDKDRKPDSQDRDRDRSRRTSKEKEDRSRPRGSSKDKKTSDSKDTKKDKDAQKSDTDIKKDKPSASKESDRKDKDSRKEIDEKEPKETDKKKEEKEKDGEKTEEKVEEVDDVECLLYEELVNMEEQPLLGLEYLWEIVSYKPTTPVRYLCKLCNTKCSAGGVMMKHICGLPHKLAYFKKHKTTVFDMISMIPLKKDQLDRVNYEGKLVEDTQGRGAVRVMIMLNQQDTGGKVTYRDPVEVPAPVPNRGKMTEPAPMATIMKSKFWEYLDEAINVHGCQDTIVIGLSYLKEFFHPLEEEPPRYACKLCNIVCTDKTVVFHVIGRKHRIAYLRVHFYEFWDTASKSRDMKRLIAEKVKEIHAKDGTGEIKSVLSKTDRLWKHSLKKQDKEYGDEGEGQEETGQEMGVTMETNEGEGQMSEDTMETQWEGKDNDEKEGVKFGIKKTDPSSTNVKPINVLDQDKPKTKEPFDWNKENAVLQAKIQNQSIIKSSRKAKFITVYAEFFKRFPVIGLQWVTEFQKPDPKLEPWYMCFMCQQKLQWKNILDHVTSSAHRIGYIKKNYEAKYKDLRSVINVNKTKGRAVIESHCRDIVAKEGNATSMEVMLELSINKEALKSVMKVKDNRKSTSNVTKPSEESQVSIVNSTVQATTVLSSTTCTVSVTTAHTIMSSATSSQGQVTPVPTTASGQQQLPSLIQQPTASLQAGNQISPAANLPYTGYTQVAGTLPVQSQYQQTGVSPAGNQSASVLTSPLQSAQTGAHQSSFVLNQAQTPLSSQVQLNQIRPGTSGYPANVNPAAGYQPQVGMQQAMVPTQPAVPPYRPATNPPHQSIPPWQKQTVASTPQYQLPTQNYPANSLQGQMQQTGSYPGQMQQTGAYQGQIQQTGLRQNPMQQTGSLQSQVQQTGLIHGQMQPAGSFQSQIQTGSHNNFQQTSMGNQSGSNVQGSAGSYSSASGSIQTVIEKQAERILTQQILQTGHFPPPGTSVSMSEDSPMNNTRGNNNQSRNMPQNYDRHRNNQGWNQNSNRDQMDRGEKRQYGQRDYDRSFEDTKRYRREGNERTAQATGRCRESRFEDNSSHAKRSGSPYDSRSSRGRREESYGADRRYSDNERRRGRDDEEDRWNREDSYDDTADQYDDQYEVEEEDYDVPLSPKQLENLVQMYCDRPDDNEDLEEFDDEYSQSEVRSQTSSGRYEDYSDRHRDERERSGSNFSRESTREDMDRDQSYGRDSSRERGSRRRSRFDSPGPEGRTANSGRDTDRQGGRNQRDRQRVGRIERDRSPRSTRSGSEEGSRSSRLEMDRSRWSDREERGDNSPSGGGVSGRRRNRPQHSPSRDDLGMSRQGGQSTGPNRRRSRFDRDSDRSPEDDGCPDPSQEEIDKLLRGVPDPSREEIDKLLRRVTSRIPGRGGRGNRGSFQRNMQQGSRFPDRDGRGNRDEFSRNRPQGPDSKDFQFNRDEMRGRREGDGGFMGQEDMDDWRPFGDRGGGPNMGPNTNSDRRDRFSDEFRDNERFNQGGFNQGDLFGQNNSFNQGMNRGRQSDARIVEIDRSGNFDREFRGGPDNRQFMDRMPDRGFNMDEGMNEGPGPGQPWQGRGRRSRGNFGRGRGGMNRGR